MNTPTISPMARIWAMFDTDPLVQRLKAEFPNKECHEKIVNELCRAFVQADSLSIQTQYN